MSIIRLKTSVKNQITIEEANTTALSSGKPLYELELKLDMDNEEAAEDTDYYLSDIDISGDDLSVEFLVSQSVETKTNESIILTITASPMTFIDNDNVRYSSNEVIMGYKEVNPENIIISSEQIAVDTLVVTVSYTGINRTIPSGTGLFIFTTTWKSNEELKAHPGVYTADVSMTYVVE